MLHTHKWKPVDLYFNELEYSIPSGCFKWKKGSKKILKGISGRFLSGKISAILGPSGAGKSTLLNVLSGFRTDNVSGDILINGEPRSSSWWFRKQSCYIMQDDYALQYLTVQESINASVSLKLGNSISKFKKQILIKEILETLNLEECEKTRVANLSGGEKKRLSIAMELPNSPPMMFLDEPTSGLDSQNSYYCISILRQLSKSGRNVVCTIHQPSARLFEMFDYVYALADGHCIYKGTSLELVPYLSSLGHLCPPHHNPMEFLLEVASRESKEFITQMTQTANCQILYADEKIKEESKRLHDVEMGESEQNLTENMMLLSKEIFSQRSACIWTQFRVLFVRTFRSVVRDRMLTILQFATNLFIGLLLGLIYFNVGNEASRIQNNLGVLYISLLFIHYVSMMMTILTFPLEINVYVREHFNHWYSLGAFYCARTLTDIPLQTLYSFTFITIVYFMTNQPYEVSRYLLITLFSILTSIESQSIGLTIGAAMDAQKAVYLGSAIMLLIAVYSGFLSVFSTFPIYLRWMTYLAFSRYSFRGYMISIYGIDRERLDCAQAFCPFRDPEKILETYEIEEEGSLYTDFLILFMMIIVTRIIGYFILRWKLRIKK